MRLGDPSAGGSSSRTVSRSEHRSQSSPRLPRRHRSTPESGSHQGQHGIACGGRRSRPWPSTEWLPMLASGGPGCSSARPLSDRSTRPDRAPADDSFILRRRSRRAFAHRRPSTTPGAPFASRLLAQRQLSAGSTHSRDVHRLRAEKNPCGGRLISSQRPSRGEGCARSLEPFVLGGGRRGRQPPATASARPAPPRQCPHIACAAGTFGSSGGGWQPKSIRYLANASRSRPGWNGSVPSFRSCATRFRS